MTETSQIRNQRDVSRIIDQCKRREYRLALAQHLQQVRNFKTHAYLTETDEFELQGRRVLVVEDNYEQASKLTDFLRSYRIEVVGPFPRAKEAIKYLKHDWVDAALLDVFLADGNAIGLAKALSETHTPFAIVTGYQRKVIPAELRNAPYYCKPCSRNEITSFLRSALR
ncbi:response regulator [Neorhizobium sp. LMR1-1-1.1]